MECSNVIRARTLLGINAASTYQKQAQDFIKMALGLEIQTDILDGISVLPKAIRNNYENQWSFLYNSSIGNSKKEG